MKRVILFILFLYHSWLMAQFHVDYVTVDCNSFYDVNGDPFRPLAMNYIIHMRPVTRNAVTGAALSPPYNYYLASYTNYCSPFGIPPHGATAFELAMWGGARHCGDSVQWKQKVVDDIHHLKTLGFNSIRVIGIAPDSLTEYQEYLVTSQASNPYAEYFRLLDQFIDILESEGMYAILSVGARTAYTPRQWDYHKTYDHYLKEVATHYAGNPTVMAYDLYNEPGWLYTPACSDTRDKYAAWVENSYWTIKKYARGQLVTIGLSDPPSTQVWDPDMMTVDFISYHFYPTAPDDNLSAYTAQFQSMAYWAGNYTEKPWIIGETAYSGTNNAVSGTSPDIGTGSQQFSYALSSMQKSLNCGSIGYSWWTYNDDEGGSNPADWISIRTVDPGGVDKPVASAFASYAGMAPAACTNGGTTYPVPSPDLNVNGWSRRWYNIADDIGGYRTYTSGCTGPYTYGWIFGSSDKFYAGDFDGDDLDELLAVSASRMAILKFVNGEWIVFAENGGAANLWPGIFPYRNNLIVGDFDGDGTDEVLGNGGASGWWTLFRFNVTDWQWVASDYGNLSNPVRPYGDYIVAGDFNGDGADELLGVDVVSPTVRRTAWFSFNMGTGMCTMLANDGGTVNNALYPMSYISPYSDQFTIGDFNNDNKDEVIAGDLPAGGQAVFQVNGSGVWILAFNDAGTSSVFYAMRPYRNNYVVGNFYFGYLGEEILGLSPVSGAQVFRRQGNTFVSIWNGGTQPIADWSHHLSATTYDPTRYFFLRTYPNVPSLLSTIYTNSTGITRSGMYSFNHGPACLSGKSGVVDVTDKVSARVYPNPSDGRFTLDLMGGTTPAEIRVLNTLGQAVHYISPSSSADGRISMDLSFLPGGVYWITWNDGIRDVTEKIVITE